MEHPDAERLTALAARLEPSTRAERAHIDGCAHCVEELARFREAIALVASGEPDALVSPPARVWDRVLSELETEDAPEPVPGSGGVGPDSPAGCGR